MSVALAAVVTSQTRAAAADKPSRPNVVFIFSDDHAYQALSCYDQRFIKTPNIDRIAQEGVRFDRCYVTNSLCGPMRAVIQTGKYSHVNGFLQNGNRFDGDQWTFPKALQKAGYQTAVVGKWHLGTHQAPQGYNYSEVLVGQGPYYNPPMLLDANGDGDRETIKHVGYTTDIITDQALGWLKEKRDPDKPFMLMFQHKAPHREWSPGPAHLHANANPKFPEPATLFEDYSDKVTPRQTQAMTISGHMRDGADLKIDWAPGNLTAEQRERYLAAFREENEAFHKANLQGDDRTRWNYQRYMRIYLASIQSVDDNVGRVLDYLDESGLADNTVVIYCSDQGFYLGEHGWFDKRWVYEESLRTPFLVRWPGKIKPGGVNSADIVSPVDFAATFCEITGAETP
ncbi:MAG: sulfatase-like hydrolase/transferase, partial [Planctomycetales bacterium]|nr:sulfatase-like hydrolase/transferase [Planctomycetales bacterium]